MAVQIHAIAPGSLAGRCGILSGHTLLSIDSHAINDGLDYRFYMTGRRLRLTLADTAGVVYEKKILKKEYEELGLEFETYLIDRQRSCRNKCVFCFIDQLPPGLRESLYFKDDDSRMSFLFGNYITLTNLTDQDIGRILTMHISPVNVSVHTTNPELRVSMMKNPVAGGTLSYLPRLTGAGIRVNAQIVLCPGYNDGEELRRSLKDLTALAPGLQSVSVVPVGLTRFREGLPEMRAFTPSEAAGVIGLIDSFGERMLELHGDRICWPGDEFFLIAGKTIPPHRYYGEYPQLQNGVGMTALLSHEFALALSQADSGLVSRRCTIATGIAAAPRLRELAALAMARFPGLELRVKPVRNDFFGQAITVSGLVCGSDIAAQLSGEELGQELLLPENMLRREGDLFLDGTSRVWLGDTLQIPVRIVENNGFSLLDAMLNR